MGPGLQTGSGRCASWVVGKTLVCQDGRWLIRHGAGDYKTGRSYGERPPLVVAASIYPEVRALPVMMG